MAGRPLRRARALAAMDNPVEFDTSRAASMKAMRQHGWMDTNLGPWLPGARSRLVKTGAKLVPLVRVILPDINNRFTVQQVAPEIGVVKILVSSENAGPHALKGVNFWHRLFDDPGGGWILKPTSVAPDQMMDWIEDNVPYLGRLRLGYPGMKALEFDRALSSTKYALRTGRTIRLANLFPVVRTNMPEPGWNTEEDRMADMMASVLGFIRGLKLSVLSPPDIYRIKRGLARGVPPEVTAEAYAIDLPTPDEEEELRALLRPMEEYAEKIIQHNFAKAAKVGMVMLWEQPRAQDDPSYDRPGYTSSKAAINQLMRQVKPPEGYRIF